MAKFAGYYQGWDKCECGARLTKVGEGLRHRSGGAVRHQLVVRKRTELISRRGR